MAENAFIKFKALLFIFIIAAAVALILYFAGVFKKPASQTQTPVTPQTQTSNPPENSSPSQKQPATSSSGQFVPPIDNWQARVTKKPFGIYITPQNSPVQPERFSGYHAGVDFETFSDEQNTDVQIYAICSGKLLQKRWVSGYGGLAVLQCSLENQEITVIYGHLNLASITVEVKEQIMAGEKIGILGKGFSSETDGERKHLHLGIQKRTAIDIRGYVQMPAELQDWLDITKYLK